MKTIGLIGGMSWQSSLEYYRILNETVNRQCGGFHSAKSILYSVDFDEIERLQHEQRWDEAETFMIAAAQSLERAGADFVILCTNTMHLMADAIAANLDIPFLHIADATAAKISTQGLQTVGLLGTKFTMEKPFYRGRLMEKHGLTVLIPEEGDRQFIHDVIYQELCQGVINPASKVRYLNIIETLIQAGAEGVILGCTEIEQLVQPDDTPVDLFPTTRLHAEAAVTLALTSE